MVIIKKELEKKKKKEWIKEKRTRLKWIAKEGMNVVERTDDQRAEKPFPEIFINWK